MKGKIYLIQDNDDLVEMEEKEYEKEIVLQELLAKYPNLLAGEQMDPENSRRWLLVTQELTIPSDEENVKNFYLDHLFLDQDGIPTLVEVKRSTDTRIRREVIGQMFDYAANAVVYLPVEDLRERVEKQYEDLSLMDEFLDPETNIEKFWQDVKTNLHAGKIRMVFVADIIPPGLKRIIEFLNEQMDPAEVLGVEVKQFVDSENKVKTLVPRVIGQTMEAQIKKTAGKREPLLNEKSFMAVLDDNGKLFFQELFKFASTEGLVINWGTKGFSLNVDINGNKVSILRGYSTLSTYNQSLFSTIDTISRKVQNGDTITEQYLKVIDIRPFYAVGNGFGLKIQEKLPKNDFKAFKDILSEVISSIRENGLKK